MTSPLERQPNMKRFLLVVLALVLLPVLLFAAGVTRITFGTSLPTNCVDGNIFIKTSATTGLYWCSTPGSPGTWSAVGGGGSGTVTTTGSPASGNLTKFSGATSITNGDLSGDITTSGTLATTIANSAVTLAKIQNAAASSKLLGSGASGSGSPYSELTLGGGLSMSGTTLSVTGGGSGVGGLVFLQTYTPSAASSVDITSQLSGTYNDYRLVLSNITTSANTKILIRFSTNNGSTWVGTNDYTWGGGYAYNGGSGYLAGSTTATLIQLRDVDTTLATNGAYNAQLTLFNVNGANRKDLVGQVIWDDNAVNALTLVNFFGGLNTTTAINAIQILPQTGTFSGSVYLFGYAK